MNKQKQNDKKQIINNLSNKKNNIERNDEEIIIKSTKSIKEGEIRERYINNNYKFEINFNQLIYQNLKIGINDIKLKSIKNPSITEQKNFKTGYVKEDSIKTVNIIIIKNNNISNYITIFIFKSLVINIFVHCILFNLFESSRLINYKFHLIYEMEISYTIKNFLIFVFFWIIKFIN